MMSRIPILMALILLVGGCTSAEPSDTAGAPHVNQTQQPNESIEAKKPPEPLPKGVLVDEIPEPADVMFSSVRHILNDTACLDENYKLKDNFINDPACNALIYASDGQLASPLQLFALDIDTGNAIQITNTDCSFASGQAIDSKTIMTSVICSDSDGNGRVNLQDQPQLYVLDLETEQMDCLTCALDLTAINNPDYSSAAGKIVFSAGTGQGMNNRIFAIDMNKNLVQITNDTGYLDFDCSWSEDGSKIVFSRLPNQQYPFSIPSQVWLMDADGTDLEKITDGGENPSGEENQGPYPIGIDADPDLSPDNKKIVFSRLKTGKQNTFGIYELMVIDADTKKEEILDSRYANMLPEWKKDGILFLRQIGGDLSDAMGFRQSVYLYKDGQFKDLEGYPFNVFPVGAYSCSWIDG